MFDSSNDRDGEGVDFLIGGGGSVLGDRLSEDSSVGVLLLEAGPDYAAARDVPMVEGIRLARRLARTEPLASLHESELFPGDAVRDDADTLAPILKASVSFYNHATGTVRMGPRSDPQAVVDATGAVRGVSSLSVADASIMPTPPSNVTMLTTMAIAEKVARDLRTQLYAARAAVPAAATGVA
jgi:choline dehydrogenase-like flavoprotein